MSEKKFSRECVRVCVKETRLMKNIEDLLDFYLTANNETRKNVTGLIKEAISSSVRVADNKLVIGILGMATKDKNQPKISQTIFGYFPWSKVFKLAFHPIFLSLSIMLCSMFYKTNIRKALGERKIFKTFGSDQ